MQNTSTDSLEGARRDLHGGHKPALQVICLGSGGGPSEDDVTGFLVRSIASDWAKGSLLAVDAGSHLAPITRILEEHFPRVSGCLVKSTDSDSNQSNGDTAPSSSLRQDFARASLSPSPSPDGDVAPAPMPTTLDAGPFAGLKFPNASARANGLHVIRTYVSTYLLTHPHLDHLSGFAINTAAFHATSRPKTVAALPSTVDAIKTHIFNDIIWPNLSDEDGGVGFVTFQRLKEGGDVMVGEGEGRGYIDVSDGLGVKAFKVSHGVCTKSPPSRFHRGSIAGLGESQVSYNGSGFGGDATTTNMQRSMSISQHGQISAPGTPRQAFYSNNANQHSPHLAPADQHACVVDSTAFFVRDTESNREILMFGDVEPDSISLSPRNINVWHEAARKIAHGCLSGIFIECSYDDSQGDAVLFGHLNPKHLIAELQTLASLATEAKVARQLEKANRKRKRSGPNTLDAVARHSVAGDSRKRSRSLAGRTASRDLRRGSVPANHMSSETPQQHAQLSASVSGDSLDMIQLEHLEQQQQQQQPQSAPAPTHEPISPKSVRNPPPAAHPPPPRAGPGTGVSSGGDNKNLELPLRGIKIIVIHIKDMMKDGPPVSENILAQLIDYERRLREDGQGLGCEFVISRSGESYWL